VKEYQKLIAEDKGEPVRHARGLHRGEGDGGGACAARQEARPRELHQGDGVDTGLRRGGFKVSYGPGKHNGSQFVDLTIISKDQKFVR